MIILPIALFFVVITTIVKIYDLARNTNAMKTEDHAEPSDVADGKACDTAFQRTSLNVTVPCP